MEEGSPPSCVSCVLNDLDLTVSVGGVTYFPNGLSGPDRINNAERVIVEGVQNQDNATITVTAYNLANYDQQYSLVATGCFGGVTNQIFANGACSVFVCDNSQQTRMQTILMAVFIPLGILIICCGGHALWKRRQQL